ncbi:type 2 lanthipeptide synthetase LanM [Streptomyces brasiliscabiei]|uniref:type 2 lanthipeptide synthetase LanM n=1 Tax=Streptomyces brasiliscabiei TaxID=2736302 RepID=UPI001C11257B|nr:type 2 lanthipeptide synthetase LanM [Streptomyces brasiliscabiei]
MIDSPAQREPHASIPAFLPFYRSVIPRDTVTGRLRDIIARASRPEHIGALLDQVWHELVATVESHSFRMLIGEFHAFREQRGLAMTADSDRALRSFRQYLEQPDNCHRITARYAVLQQRLDDVLSNSLDAYADVFAAYAQDRSLLHTSGLLCTGNEYVVGLFATGADLHNDNRKVVGLEVINGTKLVFKPRTLDSDSFVRDLYAAADSFLTYSLRDCVPASVTIGSHGWQKFVTPQSMTCADHPARYFYRFGALCALFGSIGASDLHDENILAVGEYPCIIDTETIVRPNAGVDNDSLPHVLINQLKLSVVSTMLVPMANPGSPIDLIMAGVGINGNQISKMKRPVIHHAETDSIAVRWENVTHCQTDNVPRLGGEALSPIDHFEHIIAGYLDALGAIRDHSILKVLDSYPDMRVRCLIRSTMVYSRFIDASTHPDYLRENEEADRIFRLLDKYPDYLAPAALAYVGQQERTALRTGNIPYFVTSADSTELATNKARFPAVHKTSPLDFARTGLALSSRRSDLFHRFLMEECFSEVAADRPSTLAARSVFAPAVAKAGPRTWWSEIARVLDAVSVVHDSAEGPEAGWVCGIGPDRGAPTVTPGNFISFHDVGGIVTFLENAARFDGAFRDVSLSATRGFDSLIAEYGDILSEAPESVFTGAASTILARPREVDPVWLERVLDSIDARAASGTLNIDMATGPAGLLMLLLSRIEAGKPSFIEAERLLRLRELVLAHADRPLEKPWFDVAHGRLGMQWASSRVGRVLDDSALVNNSANWLIRQLGDGHLPPVAGWCNGAAGILLAAADILVSAGRGDWLVGNQLRQLVSNATWLSEDRPVDLSVCHGSSGVVQSLIMTSRILEDPSLLEKADAYQERVLNSIRTNGFHTGVAGRTSLLGYMLGWSGIGDTDLMLHAARTGRDDFPIPVALTCGPAN